LHAKPAMAPVTLSLQLSKPVSQTYHDAATAEPIYISSIAQRSDEHLAVKRTLAVEDRLDQMLGNSTRIERLRR